MENLGVTLLVDWSAVTVAVYTQFLLPEVKTGIIRELYNPSLRWGEKLLDQAEDRDSKAGCISHKINIYRK